MDADCILCLAHGTAMAQAEVSHEGRPARRRWERGCGASDRTAGMAPMVSGHEGPGVQVPVASRVGGESIPDGRFTMG